MLLALTITARAPLAFAFRKPGRQFRASLRYVPGATLYGALGQWLDERGLFESRPELLQKLRCHNAYPSREDDVMVHPVPMSSLTPKDADPEEPPFDSLAARICWEQQRPAAFVCDPADEHGRPWEDSRWPFYALRAAQDERSGMTRQWIEPRDVHQRVLTRVAINRRRGTAEDQRLYSPLVLSEVSAGQPTQFRGSVFVPEADRDLIGALTGITHLGGRQSSGLGAVEVRRYVPRRQGTSDEEAAEQAPRTSEDTAEEIAARVRELTARFQAKAALYASLGGRAWEIRDHTIFTVNLLSDAMLYEQGWLPTTVLSAAMLEELTGIKARLLRAFAGALVVGGWNVIWQRSKPTALATAMGGVFVFQADRPLDEGDCARLAALQLDGIGERRQEGYGQIRVCDEFHITAREIP